MIFLGSKWQYIHFSANMNRTPKQQVFIKNPVDLIPLSNFTA
jgi:hypothetical protein